MSKAITAICYQDDPDQFNKLLGSANEKYALITPSQFDYENRYQAAIEGDIYKNLSFCLMKAGQVEAFIFAHKIGDVVRYNHLGVRIVVLESNKHLIGHAYDILMQQAKSHNANTVMIDDRDTKGFLSLIGAEAFNRNGAPYTKLEAVVDLTQLEEEIHRGLRKSYKSLINNGRKEMRFTYERGKDADEKLFNDFRAFHKQVAGRVTRSEESWQVQYDMVKQGQAELILGYLDQYGLVSSALFNDVGDQTIYSVAVYNRDLFDYPLAHANVYEGMMRAKARGQKSFYLGQIAPHGTVEEKEFNIGKFKKGFCEQLKSYIEWHISLGQIK